LSDSCDAFCRRLCVPDHSGLPIYFDADIADMPTAARNRWQRLSPQPEMAAAAAANAVPDFASNVA
jgi:hypothetical protein